MSSFFTKMLHEQISQKIAFIKNYFEQANPADGSVVDANANVTEKNVATLLAELHKDSNVQISRRLIADKIESIFGVNTANDYLHKLQHHEIYRHDESSIIMPYCVAISMYPFLVNGLKDLGGESEAPKHLESFCGSFVNLIFALSSQFAGAVATPEALMVFDMFARKDYGDDYLNTHRSIIENHLQHIVYAINQPAASRGFQSSFWNISIFDKYFFNGMFKHFVFPDGEKPSWESLNKLQHFFLKWISKERTKAILTFPVITITLKTHPETKEQEDTENAEFFANELAEGNSFFVYQSETVDSLSSCCRLESQINTEEAFSYTLGSVGIMTGSIHVISMNMNRLVQNWIREYSKYPDNPMDLPSKLKYIKDSLWKYVEEIHKYHVAFRTILQDLLALDALPAYKAGFITLAKQYSTIGVVGLVEACEFLGLEASNNPEYIDACAEILSTIKSANKDGKEKYKCMFNTEMVPAENLGVKYAKYDHLDDYHVTRDAYNSYFFPTENDKINVLDKFMLHGRKTTSNLDGGSANHIHLAEHLTKEQYLLLMKVAANTGCKYWTVNVKLTICTKCHFIDKNTTKACINCGCTDLEYATRIIGYLKKIKYFSTGRQKEESLRYYHRSI